MEKAIKIQLDKEYDFFIKKILNKENFMLLRYGDGERSIMLGKEVKAQEVKAQEGWVSPTGETNLGQALKNTLSKREKNVYYGISCPCCDSRAYLWYCQNIKSHKITFANMFVNINYRRFINDFEKIKRDAIVIGNEVGVGRKIGNLNILKYYSVGNQCQIFWNNEAKKLIDEIIEEYGEKNDLLYVVSAGPLAEPILCALYENNPNNCYVDFGSSIDRYIHKKDTRPYVNPNSIFGSRNCWMYERKSIDLDVSVVLTAYKKPDALEQQVKAIFNQTLLPKEIFLFQDGINEPYSILFKSELLDKFDKVEVCDENQGVWKRFDFARKECTSNYVCIFDDDTIPGERWLENCYMNMMEQEGVYGTVGIIVQNYKKYPYDGFTRIGWHNPYRNRTQVDFVGHSWFVKKEYLEYMFDSTEKYQNYKRAAEDMCLSFKCKQHGIDTFVPPHPYYDLSLWGSQPKEGIKYGNASTAISQNLQGCTYMKEALEAFVKSGWKFVWNTNHKETIESIKGAKKEYYMAVLNKIRDKIKRI